MHIHTNTFWLRYPITHSRITTMPRSQKIKLFFSNRKAHLGSPYNRAMASSQSPTKNEPVPRPQHYRQQTVDSGYGSDTSRDAATTSTDDLHSNDKATKTDTLKVSVQRQPQPYDGLLMSGESVPNTKEENEQHASSIRTMLMYLFHRRPYSDWGDISVFYDDGVTYGDSDETYASRRLVNPLCAIKVRTEIDETMCEETQVSPRTRICSLFGDVLEIDEKGCEERQDRPRESTASSGRSWTST